MIGVSLQKALNRANVESKKCPNGHDYKEYGPWKEGTRRRDFGVGFRENRYQVEHYRYRTKVCKRCGAREREVDYINSTLRNF